MNDMVADHQRRLMAADRIMFIFPVWWELMPAMTKGLLDKVYANGILYEQDDGLVMPTKLKRDVDVVLVTVMGTPGALYSTVLGKPVVNALRRGTFMKAGGRGRFAG